MRREGGFVATHNSAGFDGLASLKQLLSSTACTVTQSCGLGNSAFTYTRRSSNYYITQATDSIHHRDQANTCSVQGHLTTDPHEAG